MNSIEVANLRARFNHDWLSNRFLLLVSSAYSQLCTLGAGSVPNSFLSGVYEWWDFHAELQELIAGIKKTSDPSNYCTPYYLEGLSRIETESVRRLFYKWYMQSQTYKKIQEIEKIRLEISRLIAELSPHEIDQTPEFWGGLLEHVTTLNQTISGVSASISLPK